MTTEILASPSSLVQPLNAAIKSLIDANHLFLLVDPALHDPLATMEDVSALPKQVVPVPALPPNRRPYLLDLQSAALNERILNHSFLLGLEEGQGTYDLPEGSPRSMCAWIQAASGQKIGDLAAALACRATVSMSPAQTVTFRFWDPRISSHLPRVLGEGEMSAFLGEIGAVTWWTFFPQSDGTQHLASLGHGRSLDMANQKFAHRWVLDSGQWQALTALGWANRIRQLVPSWDLPSPPDHLSLERIANQALAWGLTSEHDLLCFAYFALAYHPQFDKHPKVRAALEAAKNDGDISFADITQGWDESFKEELGKGGGQARATVY